MKKREPKKIRNPYIQQAIKKAGIIKSRREKRVRDKLRKLLIEDLMS